MNSSSKALASLKFVPWIAKGLCALLILSLTTPPAQAQTEETEENTGLSCQATDAGWTLPYTWQWQEEDIAVYEELAQLGARANKIRENLFIRTNVTTSQASILALRQQMAALQTTMNTRLEMIEKDGRLEFALLEAYLQVARSLILIELTMGENTLSPYRMAEHYGISLSMNSYQALFNSEYRYISGTSIQAQGGNKYLLTLSPSTSLALYLRALSRAPQQLKDKQKSMLDAIKCALSVTHIQKIEHHKALIGEKNLRLALNQSAEVCPQMNAADVQKSAQLDVQNIYEDIYRQAGILAVPTPYDNLNEKMVHAVVTQPTLAVLMPRFFLLPTKLDLALASYGINISSLDINVQQLVKEVALQTDQIYTDEDYAQLKNIFEPNWLVAAQRFGTSCGVREDVDVLNSENIQLVDAYFFPLNLQTQLNALKIKIQSLPEKERLAIIQKTIIWARKDAIYESIRQAYDYLRDALSPDATDLVFALQTEMDPWIEQKLNEPKTRLAIESLAKKIHSALQTSFAEAKTDVNLRADLVQSATDKAKEIAVFHDKNTTGEDLPFVQSALERLIEDRINGLSGVFLSYFQTIASKADFFAQKEAWRLVEPRLKEMGEKLSAPCERPSWLQDKKEWVASWFSIKPAAEFEFKRQCEALHLYAAIIGLNEDARPKKLADYLSTLKAHYKDKDLDALIALYRKELEVEQFRVAPILASEVRGKILWQRLNSSNQITAQDGFIKEALSESYKLLNASLLDIQKAKKLEDLAVFFKRTKTLKVIFGGDNESQQYLQKLGLNDYQGEDISEDIDELSLDFGVMTQLRAEHDKIQNQFYRTERIQSEIFSDYIFTHIMIGLGALGTQGLKWLTHRMPRWSGAPQVSRVIDIGLNRSRDMVIFHANTFGSILLYQIGIAQIEKEGFKTDLKNIRHLYQTELPGLNSSLSLISFQEFIRQRQYVNYMLKELTSLQKWNAAFIMLPFVVDLSMRRGQVMKARFRDLREIKLEQYSAAQRTAIEGKIIKHSSRQRQALDADLRRLGSTELHLSSLQSNLDRIRRTAKSEREILLARESYERIVFEIGKEVQMLNGKTQLLNVYSRGLLGKDVSSRELLRYLSEYEKIFAQSYLKAGAL